MDIIPIMLLGLAGYMTLGLVFALWFLLAGVKRIDDNPMSWPAKIALLPGCCAVWPVLLVKAVRG